MPPAFCRGSGSRHRGVCAAKPGLGAVYAVITALVIRAGLKLDVIARDLSTFFVAYSQNS